MTRRLGDATLAADLAQEAYARLAALPDNTHLLNPRAYLFAAARSLLADHWRAQARMRRQGGMALELVPAPAGRSK